MNILVTNDDGIGSPGLRALAEALGKEHEVWVVAPDGERSGTSHYVTLKGPIRFVRLAEREYAVGGSPADCVILAALGALPVRPDLVVSGINCGPNFGTDLVYSGTAAAARQGALMHLPGLAVSMDFSDDGMDFRRPAQFMAVNLGRLLELWTPAHFININFPCREEYGGVSVTHPCRRVYNDSLKGFSAPDGKTYYFIQGDSITIEEEEGSDWQAVSQGFVSVSPVHLHPHLSDERSYRAARFEFT
jgi:5'-nucleotidase